HALVREGGFHSIRLEILVEEFLRTIEEEAPQEVLRLRTAEERDEIGDRDRRGEQHRFDEIVDLGPHCLVLRIRRGIFLGELREIIRGNEAVVPRAYDDEVYRGHGPGAGKPSLRMSVSFRPPLCCRPGNPE